MATDSKQAFLPYKIRLLGGSSKVVRFLLHFLEMQIAMGVGMIPWHWLVRQLRASPTFAETFQRGSDLSILGHGLFMTVPMVVWMILRRHGWRHSLEMGLAMFAPGVAIIVLCWLGADTFWPWLMTLASPAGTVGMLAYMLYRRDHFTLPAGYSAHSSHPASEPCDYAGRKSASAIPGDTALSPDTNRNQF